MESLYVVFTRMPGKFSSATQATLLRPLLEVWRLSRVFFVNSLKHDTQDRRQEIGWRNQIITNRLKNRWKCPVFLGGCVCFWLCWLSRTVGQLFTFDFATCVWNWCRRMLKVTRLQVTLCGCSVHFSSVPWPIGSSGGHEERFRKEPLPVFSAGGRREQFWHGQGYPLFDVVHLAFALPITVSPTLQGAFKDGFGEAVGACDVPGPCKFPSPDSCLKKFLWTHKGIHPTVIRITCSNQL